MNTDQQNRAAESGMRQETMERDQCRYDKECRTSEEEKGHEIQLRREDRETYIKLVITNKISSEKVLYML